MHWIDPNSLKPLKAKLDRFLFNPNGDADGMLLANGLEAHFPPHLSAQLLKAIQTGEVVTLLGVKPRDVEMIACVAIETAKGERIDDMGPPSKKKKKPKGRGAREHELVEVEDTVERALHGPKGEVRGVLLASGCIVRFPPHVAQGARRLLTQGAVLAVRGEATRVSGSTVIDAKALGTSKADLQPVAPKHHE